MVKSGPVLAKLGSAEISLLPSVFPCCPWNSCKGFCSEMGCVAGVDHRFTPNICVIMMNRFQSEPQYHYLFKKEGDIPINNRDSLYIGDFKPGPHGISQKVECRYSLIKHFR